MAGLLTTTSREPVSICRINAEDRWMAALQAELQRSFPNQGYRRYRFESSGELSPLQTRFFLLGTCELRAPRACEQLVDLVSRGWAGVVVGGRDLLPWRLCFQCAGALTTLTSIFELAKVARMVHEVYLAQPARMQDWKTEYMRRIPWPTPLELPHADR